MSTGTNIAPAVGTHMHVQLLLCIGLPMLILPCLTAIAYFGFQYFKARKNTRTDVEQGDCIKTSTRTSSGGESDELQYEMTPALLTKSVQIPPAAVFRNF